MATYTAGGTIVITKINPSPLTQIAGTLYTCPSGSYAKVYPRKAFNVFVPVTLYIRSMDSTIIKTWSNLDAYLAGSKEYPGATEVVVQGPYIIGPGETVSVTSALPAAMNALIDILIVEYVGT